MEPLEDGLTAAFLQEKLGKRKKSIKEMLHDQSIVAGIGNIYSDEILYAAEIYPGEKCAVLDAADWNRLAGAMHPLSADGRKNCNRRQKQLLLPGLPEKATILIV